MRNVTFDSISISSGDYNVKTIQHDSATPRDLFMYDLSRESGADLISTAWTPKKIIVNGLIKGDSIDNLEANIDTFKKVLSGKNKVLDIEYASGTRRYIATAKVVQIEKDYYNISYVPYTVEFTVPAGFGADTTSSTFATVSIALTTLEDDNRIDIGGTAIPKYTIEIDFNSADTVTSVSLTINGDKITVEETITAGQELVIDTENKKVTIDSVETDYTGLFPRLYLGVNSYKIVTTSVSHQYDVLVTYTKKYL